MNLSPVTFIILISVTSLTFSGCSTPHIPNDQLKNFALAVPQDIYGNGSAITKVGSGSDRLQVFHTTEGPGILPNVSTRRGANLLPGKQAVQVTTCHSSDTRSCRPDIYIFDAKPGLVYVLRGPGQNIDVLDRFKKSPLGYLYPIENNEFVSEKIISNLQLSAEKKAAEEALAVMAQRRQDQIFIRKIGTQVCQEFGRGMIYVGYIEKVTNEKVQIRIADAHLKGNPTIHPKEFTPSIIWDFPMQWDLCR